MSIESVMPSNRLILCCPLLLLPSIFPSIKVFSSEQTLHIWWSKYWRFNFSISLSSDYSELNSFRIDWFDLAIQGTFKSPLQHYSLKTLVWHLAFFVVRFSHLYMATRKTTALTRWTFFWQVMALLFNTWSTLSQLYQTLQSERNSNRLRRFRVITRINKLRNIEEKDTTFMISSYVILEFILGSGKTGNLDRG